MRIVDLRSLVTSGWAKDVRRKITSADVTWFRYIPYRGTGMRGSRSAGSTLLLIQLLLAFFFHISAAAQSTGGTPALATAPKADKIARNTTTPNASGQANPADPQKGGATQKTDKPPVEYFQKIHRLRRSCVITSIDTSNTDKITNLRFHPAQTDAAGNPTCTTGLPVNSTNAAPIAKALGSDAEFSLVAMGPDRIVIYAKSKSPSVSRLAALERAIDNLSGTDFKYAEVISVPPGKAKLFASQVSTLNSGGLTADALDGPNSSSILLKSIEAPNAAILDDVRQRIFDLRWQVPVAPPTQRLFHLDATTVTKDLSDSGNKTSGKDSAGNKGAGSVDTAAVGESNSATSTASPSISISLATPSAAAPADAKNSVDGNATDSAGDSKVGDVSASAKKSVTADAKGADSTVQPLTMKAVNDTLVYSNVDGTDRGIYERNRLMAVLDLPRPEVLLNMWALQASSRDYKVTNTEAQAIRGAVVEHNQLLQDSIDDGWDYLSREIKRSPTGFFDVQFYNYITQKFAIGENVPSSGPKEEESQASLRSESTGKALIPHPKPSRSSNENLSSRLSSPSPLDLGLVRQRHLLPWISPTLSNHCVPPSRIS